MIEKDEIKRIAKLARLGITKKEEAKFQKELSGILDYFKMLQEVDTSGIEPTFHPAEKFLLEKGNIFREDNAQSQTEETVKKLVEAVPEKEKNYIKVKAVLA